LRLKEVDIKTWFRNVLSMLFIWPCTLFWHSDNIGVLNEAAQFVENSVLSRKVRTQHRTSIIAF